MRRVLHIEQYNDGVLIKIKMPFWDRIRYAVKLLFEEECFFAGPVSEGPPPEDEKVSRFM